MVESPLSIVPDETSFVLQTNHPIGTFRRSIDFRGAHAQLCPRLRQGGCGCNHGSQYTRHHGQGRTEEADREHEIPGVHGTVAPVKKHCGVSAPRHQPNRRFIVILIIYHNYHPFFLPALLFTEPLGKYLRRCCPFKHRCSRNLVVFANYEFTCIFEAESFLPGLKIQ